jgi:hypothetical protein
MILAIVTTLALGACGGSRSLLPEHEVELFEFGIQSAPEWSSAAPVILRNSGEFPHTLVITRGDGGVVFASDVIAAGETATVPLDLEPGDYELSCRLVAQTEGGDLVDHFEEGMRADLTIVE